MDVVGENGLLGYVDSRTGSVQALTALGMGTRDDVSEEDEWVWVCRGHDSREFGSLQFSVERRLLLSRVGQSRGNADAPKSLPCPLCATITVTFTPYASITASIAGASSPSGEGKR